MTKKTKIDSQKYLSKLHLAVFILVFGLIGVIIWRSMAAGPNPNLPGDLDGNNKVDGADLSILLNDFGTANPAADIDGNGRVDIIDLSILLRYFGQTYNGGATGYTPTYYVSNSGSDSNSGTGPSSPWKTVAKVQNTCLKPGDVVAFAGGQTFSDTYLDSKCSGTAAAPIVFTSYGSGRAKFNQIWLDCGQHDMTFDNLEATNNNSGSVILFASGNCSSNPVYDITLQNSYLHDTQGEALQSNTNDHNWLIQNNTFQHTGDSALILYYSTNMTVTKNTITDTGWNSSITYGKHGIYSKSPNTIISYNDISDDQNGQAISIRTHGQSIYGNAIHDTSSALAFFDYDTAAPPQGTTYIYYNRVYNITGYAFYYDNQLDPQGKTPSVSFVIANNTFVGSNSTEMFNLSLVPSAASVTTVNNVFSGGFGSAYRGCPTCTEHYDDWYGGTSNPASGANDLFADPKLNAAPGLSLQSGSPAVNAGITSVPGLTYSAGSDGAPLHYQGSAPDLGAVESAY